MHFFINPMQIISQLQVYLQSTVSCIMFFTGWYIMECLGLSMLNVALACFLVWLSHGKFALPNHIRYIFVKILGKFAFSSNETEASNAIKAVISSIETKTLDELLFTEKYAAMLLKKKDNFSFEDETQNNAEIASSHEQSINERQEIYDGNENIHALQEGAQRSRNSKLKIIKVLKSIQKHLASLNEVNTYLSMKAFAKSIDAEDFAREELKQIANNLNRLCGILFIITNVCFFLIHGYQIMKDDD